MNKQWDKFIEIIKQSDIPIVVLDHDWHKLFVRFKKPLQVKMLENRLNQLLKKQGFAVSELKRYKGLKSELMAKIVSGMGDAINKEDEKAFSKMNTSGKAIEELNTRVKKIENELEELPNKIKEANYALLAHSMNLCLEDLLVKKKKYNQLEDEHERLKAQMVKIAADKAEIKEQYRGAYEYMNTTFGKAAIDALDQVFTEEFHD